MRKNCRKSSIPHPLILLEICIPTVSLYTPHKMRKGRKLERYIFPRVLVCVFNPFSTQSKGWLPCLLATILCHKASGSRVKRQSHLANKTLFRVLRLPISRPPYSQVVSPLPLYPHLPKESPSCIFH